MDLEEIGINAGNWVDLAQDMNYWRALVNVALNLRVPYAIELVMILWVYLLIVYLVEYVSLFNVMDEYFSENARNLWAHG